MLRDTSNSTIHLKGNVQLIINQQYLSCDEAYINTKEKTLQAIGGVIFTTPEVYGEADKMFLNYENNTGVIYDGFLQSGQVSFESRLIYKTADNEYEVIDGYYTSCTTCPPAWSIYGAKIKASFGGYAKIKNAVFRVSQVPSLWLPYLIVPLKSERQSGVLTPGFENSSRGGSAFSLPYFWVFNESSDATISLKRYEFSGNKINLNYRYILSPNSSGELNTAWINDRAFYKDNDRIDAASSSQSLDRWYLNYKNYFELPNHYVQRTNINLASDLQYPIDYASEFPYSGDPALENHASITKNTDSTSFSLDSTSYINLLKTDPLADNDDAVHRMPELNYQLMNQKLAESPFYYSFKLNYANFSRSSFSYDKIDSSIYNSLIYDETYRPVIENNGTYAANTDLIRTGQRLKLRPSISLPMHFGIFDVQASLDYQESLYQFAVSQDPNAHSRFLQSKLKAQTNFSRVYQNDENPNESYQHSIEPQLEYTRLPYLEQSEHPFFGTAYLEPYNSDLILTDGDKLQFDFTDRFTDRNILKFSLINVWTQKQIKDQKHDYKQVLHWTLSQSYDFYEKNVVEEEKREPWSAISSKLRLNLNQYQVFNDLYYYPYQNHVNSNSYVRYTFMGSSYLQLAYEQSFKIKKGEDVDLDTRKQDWRLLARLDSGFFDLETDVSYSTVTHKITRYRAGFVVTPLGKCWNIKFIRDVATNGEYTDFLSFNLLFDGEA